MRPALLTLAVLASGGVNLDAGGNGTSSQVLHGNTSGTYAWGAVVNADISAVDAGKITTGTLPVARGGTNTAATPTNGGACYGDGSGHQFTAAGTSGQMLQSAGAAAPVWASAPRLIRVSGSNFTTTSATATNITGLSITTAAATPYYFHCVLDATGTATGGPRATVVVTTSTITSIAYTILSHTTSATTLLYTGASASGTLSATCTASCLTTDIPIIIDGMVNINANAGTITIAAANSTAGQTTTIKIGSMCDWWTP